MEQGPLPPLRSKVILLVWVRNKGIVGSHHSNIEMDEIAKERRLVRPWVSRRHCRLLLADILLFMKLMAYAYHSSGSRRSNGCKHHTVYSLSRM